MCTGIRQMQQEINLLKEENQNKSAQNDLLLANDEHAPIVRK